MVRLLIAVLLAAVPLGAVSPAPDLAAVDEAMALGRRTLGERERARFHQAYRLPVARPPVDYIEIVTPFRRVVLGTQSAVAQGARRFGQRDALELLARAPQQMDVYVELTFHPLNTLVGLPDYTVVLAGARRAIVEPIRLERVSRFVPRLEGLPPPLPDGGMPAAPARSDPLVGGTIVAVFDLRTIDPEGTYEIVLAEGKTEVARVLVDLGRLR